MMTIQISEDIFTIDNKSLEFPIDINDLKEILGVPQHFKKKYNQIYTFHDSGILAYSKNGKLVEAIALFYSAESYYDYFPKNLFNQQLRINGQTLAEFYFANKKKRDQFGSLAFGQFALYFDDNGGDTVAIFTINACELAATKPISDKYTMRKVIGEKLIFSDFNFKLAVMQELMYNQKLLKPKFDLYEFVKFHTARAIDIEAEGYELIAEVTDYFQQFEIEKKFASKITSLQQDGGNDIYLELLRFWDGEDDIFNIRSFKDAVQFKNLTSVSLFYYSPEDRQVLEELEKLGIEYDFI